MVGRGAGTSVKVLRGYRFPKLVTVSVVEWRICKCIYYHTMYRHILININRFMCIVWDDSVWGILWIARSFN
jgi:hypothetical protein